jgi:hypothetical protein
LVAMVFEVGEASSRAVAARQLEDVEAARRAREGIFEVEEASSRMAWELEDVKATRCKVTATQELEEAGRVTMVFKVEDASLRATWGFCV